MRLDILVGRERGCQVGDVVETVAEARIFDKVGRVGQACFPAAVILDFQATGPRHEMHVVAADLGKRLAIAIMQRE